MHLTASPIDWYAARAAGIAAYVVLTIVVALGLTMTGKARSSKWPKFAVEDVHRFGGLLVGFFVALHVLTVAIDSYLPFSPIQVLVPLTARYRPLWTGLGIAAAELLIALALTNHYRRRLPYRFWRRAHYLNFAVWTAALLHGLGSGTDHTRAVDAADLRGVCGDGVRARSPAYRSPGCPRPGRRSSRRDCSRARLSDAGRQAPAAVDAVRFRESMTGQILADRGVSRAVISMAGTGRGAQNVLVRADLLASANGLEATSLQLEYLPSGALCRGDVTHVESFAFRGTCRMPGGARRAVSARWQLLDGDSLRGTVESRPFAA